MFTKTWVGRTILLTMALFTPQFPINQAHAAGTMYFLCETKPITTSIHKWFFSGVFTADPADRVKIERKFTTYIANKYPDDDTGPADCLMYNSRDNADHNHSVKNYNHAVDGSVIETGWTYSE